MTMPYPQGPMTERSPEEDDRRRRDFHPQSPTHSHPVNGTHPPSPFQQFASRPSTSAAMSLPAAMSPRVGPPPSPKTNGPLPNGSVYPQRESSGSTRYDPISEHRESQSNWGQSQYHTRSPKEVCQSNMWKSVLLDYFSLTPVLISTVLQTRDSATYASQYSEHNNSPITYQSPTRPHFSQHSPTFPTPHGHPASRRSSVAQSPVKNSFESPVLPQASYGYSSRANGSMDRPHSQSTIDEDLGHVGVGSPEETRVTRTKDPMSFSSILSSNVPDPPKAPSRATATSKQSKGASHAVNGDSKPLPAAPRKSLSRPTASPREYATPLKRSMKAEADVPVVKSLSISRPKPSSVTSDKENEKVKKEMARIDAMELSDIESPDWETAKQRYRESSEKRQRDVEAAENIKRKVTP